MEMGEMAGEVDGKESFVEDLQIEVEKWEGFGLVALEWLRIEDV